MIISKVSLVRYTGIMEVILENGYINLPENTIGLGVNIDNDKLISKEYVYE